MEKIKLFLDALSNGNAALEIITDHELCGAYVADNYSHVPSNAPAAIIYPTTSEQIKTIIEMANEKKVPLVVRSSSDTKTYHGSSVPSKGVNAVAINLSKMNKIMHIDKKNGTALIEPGVTYQQLNEALAPYGCIIEHPLMPREDKSIIASLLDREPVMTPKHCWDIPDPLTCVELIMGNGSLFRTGSAAGPGTLDEMLASGCALNQPQGPYCLDLARVICGSQGTLAIVTWASVKIRKIPSARKVIYVQTDDIDRLSAYASQVIRRRLGENIFITNNKGLSVITEAKPDVGAKWTLVCDIAGYHYFPERYVSDQMEDMKDLAKTYDLSLVEAISGIDNDAVMNILDKTSPKGHYWKDYGGTQKLDIFFLSTMDKLNLFNTLAEGAVEKCGQRKEDLVVFCQPQMMGRSAHLEYIIPIEVSKHAEIEKMMGTAFLDNHAFFSRPYGLLTENIYEKSTSQTPFMKHIKQFFDENRIMNPGKLVYDEGGK